MSTIYRGDFVECIDAGPLKMLGIWTTGKPSGLTLAALYQVSDIGPVIGVPAWIALLAGARIWLSGVSRPDGDYGWGVDRFRPVLRPSTSFIASLKQPAPMREPEPA